MRPVSAPVRRSSTATAQHGGGGGGAQKRRVHKRQDSSKLTDKGRPLSAGGNGMFVQSASGGLMPSLPSRKEGAMHYLANPVQQQQQQHQQRDNRRLTWTDDTFTDTTARRTAGRQSTITSTRVRPMSAIDRSRQTTGSQHRSRRPMSATERPGLNTSQHREGSSDVREKWVEDHMSEGQLKCTFCHEDYSDPRFLACLHTFCCKCIHVLAGADDRVVCPICGSCTPLDNRGAAGLTEDLEMKAALKEAIAQGVARCGNCEIAHSELHCMNCDTSLCQQCFDITHSEPMFRKHDVVSVEQLMEQSNQQTCTLHHGKPLQYYCKACSKLMCESCFVSGTHDGHLEQCCVVDDVLANIRSTWASMATDLNSQRGRLTTCLIDTTENVSAVQKMQAQAQERVRHKFSQLREELAQCESQLSQQIDYCCSQQSEQLHGRVKDTEGLLEQLSCCLDVGERVMSSTIPSHLLGGHEAVMQQASRLAESRVPGSPSSGPPGLDGVLAQLSGIHIQGGAAPLGPSRQASGLGAQS